MSNSVKLRELHDKALALAQEIQRLRHQTPGALAFMLCHAEERQRGVIVVLDQVRRSFEEDEKGKVDEDTH